MILAILRRARLFFVLVMICSASIVVARGGLNSFSRLRGADPRLRVEMTSTGEVACFGTTMEQALLLSLKAVGFQPPRRNVLLTIGKLEDKVDMLPAIEALHRMGFSLFATHRTHEFLSSRDFPSGRLYKVSEPRSPNIKEYLENKRIDLVINIPQHTSSAEKTDGYFIRRLATDRGIALITNVQLAKRIIEALEMEKQSKEEQPLMAWPELLLQQR